MKRMLVSVVAGALCLAQATAGHAGQVTQPMIISLTIGTPGGDVSLVAGSLVLFVAPVGPAVGTTTVHVTAPANLPYVVTISLGLHADLNGRNLIGQSSRVPYGVYTDPAHTQPWGDGFYRPGVGGIGTGGDQSYLVYARTNDYPPFPDVTYTDVLTVAADF